MKIEITVLLTLVSVVLAAVFGFLAARRSGRGEIKAEATAMTTVIVKLESISADVSEIKADMKSVRDEIKNHETRIIKLEERDRAIWHKMGVRKEKEEGRHYEN